MTLSRKLAFRRVLGIGIVALLLTACVSAAYSQIVPTNNPPVYGPYNAVILQGGDGLRKNMVARDTVLRPDSPWTLYAWIQCDSPITAPVLVAGYGDVAGEYSRFLGLDPGKLMLWAGPENTLSAPATITPGKWQFVAATFDGSVFRLYADGAQVGQGSLTLGRVAPVLQIGPPVPIAQPTNPTFTGQHFGGKIAGFILVREALTAEKIKQLASNPPMFSLIVFEAGSKPWPVQTKAQAGYRAPQDPATWPKSRAPFSSPVAKPVPSGRAALQADRDRQWTIASGWQMAAAPAVTATAQEIAKTGFDTKGWLAATVPGTALTTMIDRGVYPDSDYGLNNLAIPESLNKQDYWYRDEFKAPKTAAGGRFTLTFEGINYKAEVWLNGKSLGTIKGAFIRGVFDVTDSLKPGATNVLAVRVSPPPHPGIPNEQSVRGGPGENGGLMCLDGPTFVATEGWDWIPAIRDRDTGIWQPVTLTASASVKVGDAQVVTKLPLPDTTRADIEITVPVENLSDKPVKGTLHASIESTTLTKEITVPSGKSYVKLAPAEFAQLTLQNPRLWWPNGYGKPELYQLKLDFSEDGKESDSKQVRFGVREVTYELSLLDSKGQLRRVDVSLTAARARGERVVDVTHEGMRQIPAADPFPPDFPEESREYWHSWVASLVPGAETSPAVHAVDDSKAGHYLILKVNGVRIAARGGNWGMDDSRKRVSREKLEPYFRLHRDANVNIIRNWVGQNTEGTFYDLADEYGMMVWNDFWASTQEYNEIGRASC